MDSGGGGAAAVTGAAKAIGNSAAKTQQSWPALAQPRVYNAAIATLRYATRNSYKRTLLLDAKLMKEMQICGPAQLRRESAKQPLATVVRYLVNGWTNCAPKVVGNCRSSIP